MALKFILGVLLAIAIFLFGSYLRNRYIKAKQYADFLRIFGNWKSSMPILECGSSYSWPTYKITFKSKSDFDFALKNKLIDDFKNCIKAYYSSNFDVERATHFTYENVKQ